MPPTIQDQPFSVTPWPHQAEDLAASRDMQGAFLDWDPRTGKTKITIDTAVRGAMRGTVDTAIVFAPSGVHLNWARTEIPAHWPWPNPFIIEWDTKRSKLVGFQRRLKKALETEDFVWICLNIEAAQIPRVINRSKGKLGVLQRMVRDRRCMLVVDESHTIKNHKSLRFKAISRIADKCPIRRCLTGTPIAQGPFDLWSQYYVLDPEVLGRNYFPFRTRYGVFERMRYGTGPSFDQLVEYKNLDDLQRRIAPITFVRRKRDVLKDLPERLFKREYFLLPDGHREVYEDLKKKMVVQLDAGETISAPMALTMLLRLQQISRGHATSDGGDAVELGGPYPAVERTIQLIEENEGKTIVWCRFTSDLDLLARELEAAGMKFIRVDGSTPKEDRPDLIREFNDPEGRRLWTGTLATGGVGVDLSGADLMIFYSHGFDLVQRVQGMERNYGSNQRADSISVVDLVCADTIDERALARVEDKQNLAAQITGDVLREILT